MDGNSPPFCIFSCVWITPPFEAITYAISKNFEIASDFYLFLFHNTCSISSCIARWRSRELVVVSCTVTGKRSLGSARPESSCTFRFPSLWGWKPRMGIWLTQNLHNKDGPTSEPTLPIRLIKIRLPKARRAVYFSKRMVNSLKSLKEVENQKMLCCLPTWISGRASEAPGSERIVGTYVVDTWMILEQRWEKNRKGKDMRRKSAILVLKRSYRKLPRWTALSKIGSAGQFTHLPQSTSASPMS